MIGTLLLCLPSLFQGGRTDLAVEMGKEKMKLFGHQSTGTRTKGSGHTPQLMVRLDYILQQASKQANPMTLVRFVYACSQGKPIFPPSSKNWPSATISRRAMSVDEGQQQFVPMSPSVRGRSTDCWQKPRPCGEVTHTISWSVSAKKSCPPLVCACIYVVFGHRPCQPVSYIPWTLSNQNSTNTALTLRFFIGGIRIEEDR
jgi:hypothetical protein